MGMLSTRTAVNDRSWARLAGVCLAFLVALPLSAEEYRLGVQDKLMIRIVEWQTVEGTFRHWAPISGDYTVGASGSLSIPFVGQLPAEGRTTAEIAEEISGILQQKFGLSDRPEAAVELIEYRPFYIAGQVQSPGQYPYVPGLTVLKAVSIAGGLRRSADYQRIERDFITAKGNADVFADERIRLLVRRARIIAEMEGRSDFEPPQEIADEPQVSRIVADEKAIMRARQKKLSLRLEALDGLKELLRNEIQSLEKKIATQNRQMQLAQEELSGIGSLADRGLVVNARILSAERLIADLEGRILDLETAILRARQDISRADQDAIDLQNSMDAEIANDRQQVEAELNEVDLKLRMQNGLMVEALALVSEVARSPDEAPVISFELVRTIDGKATVTAADENTPVLPGDVIKVALSPEPER